MSEDKNHEIENSEEVTSQVADALGRGKKRIEIMHTFRDERKQKATEDDETSESDDDPETLKRKLEEKSAILAGLALKDFETEKSRVLELVSEDKKAQTEAFIGTNPERLEQVKFQTGYSDGGTDDGTEPVPPKGKVHSITKSGKDTLLIQRKQYDQPIISELSKLYEIISDPEKTKREKDVAEEVLEGLFDQAQKGAQSRPQGSKYTLPSGVVMNCPSCGMTVEFDLDKKGAVCPHCGKSGDDKQLHPYRNPR
jgi:hypothetical protein